MTSVRTKLGIVGKDWRDRAEHAPGMNQAGGYARPTADDFVYSVYSPGSLRVLWDNPLNGKQYADVIVLLLIARQVDGWDTGTTP